LRIENFVLKVAKILLQYFIGGTTTKYSEFHTQMAAHLRKYPLIIQLKPLNKIMKMGIVYISKNCGTMLSK